MEHNSDSVLGTCVGELAVLDHVWLNDDEDDDRLDGFHVPLDHSPGIVSAIRKRIRQKSNRGAGLTVQEIAEQCERIPRGPRPHRGDAGIRSFRSMVDSAECYCPVGSFRGAADPSIS